MTKCNVKTGDVVVVITGKDAGKQGKVLAVNNKTNRIVVEGVNMVSKHQKAKKAQEKSQIVRREGTIDASNVMILCPTCGKPTRVKHSIVNGKSVRVCKCGATLETVKEEKKTTKKATSAKSTEDKAEKTKAPATEKTEGAEKKKVVKSVKATTTSAKSTKTTTARKAQRGV